MKLVKIKAKQFCFSFVLLLQSCTSGLRIHPRNGSTFAVYDTLVPTLIHPDNPEATLFDGYLGFNGTGTVTVLEKGVIEALQRGNRSLIQNHVVVIKLALMDEVRFLCGTKADHWEEHLCSISWLCQFGPKVLIQELFASSWFYPKRWLLDHGKKLLQQYNISSSCAHFRSYGQFLGEDTLRYVAGQSGEVIVQDAAVAPLRSHYTTFNVLFFRVASTIGYIYLTGLSARFLLNRYQIRKLNSVYILLYAFNGITCAVLAITYSLGPFFLFDITSPLAEQLQVS